MIDVTSSIDDCLMPNHDPVTPKFGETFSAGMLRTVLVGNVAQASANIARSGPAS